MDYLVDVLRYLRCEWAAIILDLDLRIDPMDPRTGGSAENSIFGQYGSHLRLTSFRTLYCTRGSVVIHEFIQLRVVVHRWSSTSLICHSLHRARCGCVSDVTTFLLCTACPRIRSLKIREEYSKRLCIRIPYEERIIHILPFDLQFSGLILYIPSENPDH